MIGNMKSVLKHLQRKAISSRNEDWYVGDRFIGANDNVSVYEITEINDNGAFKYKCISGRDVNDSRTWHSSIGLVKRAT